MIKQSKVKFIPETQKKLIAQGAEAKIILKENLIIKDRITKKYRIIELDKKIRKTRTKSETKLLKKASEIINVPFPQESKQEDKIIMPFIKGEKLSDFLDDFKLNKQKQICFLIGKEIAKLHNANIIHGDLTTSNMILASPLFQLTPQKENLSINNKTHKNKLIIKTPNLEKSSLLLNPLNPTSNPTSTPIIYFIDFGLGYFNGKYEDKAVDIHLFKQALEAKHFKNWETLFKEFEKGYKIINPTESTKVLERLKAVEKRGRYKH